MMRKLEINNRRFLGSKYKLLNFIEDTVNEHCKDVKSVVDVFAGTGVVGSLFLKNGKEVYFNDYGVITHLDPHILECEVKWALENITMNKASGGDGIPVELFQILKDL